MAVKKISELNGLVSIADDDVLPIVDNSTTETKKVTATNLKTYMQGTLPTRMSTAETNIGTIANLETTATDLVGGINEVKGQADKLENVTKYLTATAGSNGDFNINITNELQEGMMLNISFPTATGDTQNAQFSVDGGTTYYPISRPADAVQLIVSDIAEKRVTLFFTGTEFLVINGANIKGKTIIIRKNQTQTMPATTRTRLTFQTVDAGYDSNVFDLSSNGILLKSKFIKSVSITMGYQTTGSVGTITYVDKNSTQVVALGRASADSGTMSTSFNATYNDTIYFAMYASSETTVTSASNWNWAVLTVLDTYE